MARKLSPTANASFANQSLGENGEFTRGIGLRKLDDIVKNKMRHIDFGTLDEAYNALSPANQRALAHLVKAAEILDDVYLKQDHPDNIRAKQLLEKSAAAGDTVAAEALTLFRLHNGLEGPDMYAPKTIPLALFKDKKLHLGKGFYPQDLTKKELVEYIVQHPEQASAIFGSNTMVQRNGNRLVAVPYSVAFRTEMEDAARELLAAAKETDHAGFAQYLRWQAQALVNDSDAEMTFNADKAWANIEDSPLEFTIGRECYEDMMSSEAAADPRVKAILDENGIKAKNKDSIGVRVGIVNQESYAVIAHSRKYLEKLGERMPLKEEYKDTGAEGNERKMTFADVDLVAFTGDYAAVRGGITIAQNLPNGDKLAVQEREGNRLVFHRQVRESQDPAQQQKFLDALIEPSQHHLYTPKADFVFTVRHELGHSEGPSKTKDGRDNKASLGGYGNMLEEMKADLISVFMTAYLVEIGEETQKDANEIYLTWAAGDLPNKQPSPEEAHRSRSIMQHNYFVEKGAIIFKKGGKLSIVPEKMADAAKQALTEVIQIQLDGDPAKAEAFVKKYAAWNDALQYAADEKMKLKPKLYRLIDQPLAKKLLKL